MRFAVASDPSFWDSVCVLRDQNLTNIKIPYISAKPNIVFFKLTLPIIILVSKKVNPKIIFGITFGKNVSHKSLVTKLAKFSIVTEL